MAGGQRIDDHRFWAGGPGKNTVFPDGPHKTKEVMSDGHAGHLKNYEDTNEEVVRQQRMSVKKQEGHDRKELHRN